MRCSPVWVIATKQAGNTGIPSGVQSSGAGMSGDCGSLSGAKRVA